MVEEVVNIKPLKDYAVPIDEELHCSIFHSSIAENNFEVKSYLVGMVQQHQFSGLPTENLNLRMSIFIEFCCTLKSIGVDQNSIRLSLFYFSLRDRARAWLQSFPANSITTWAQLK